MSYKLWIACLLALPANPLIAQVTPAPVAPVAPKPVTPGGKKAIDPRTAQILLDQARACLDLGSLKPARDCYLDLLSIDPRNGAAMSELGYIYLKLEDYPRAKTVLDQAATLPQPARHTVINASAMMIRTRIPMRAAKFIQQYMAAHPNDTDEQLINALGTSLSIAMQDDQTRRNKFFDEMATYYEGANAKLEATKPGQKRWGSQWMSPSEADKKLSKYKKDTAELARLEDEMRTCRNRAATAQQNMEAAISRSRFAKVKPDTSGYQREIQAANSQGDAAKKKYDDLEAKIERPPFPEQIAAVAPDFPAMAIASAAATPSGPPVTTPAVTTPTTTPPLTPPAVTTPPVAVVPPTPPTTVAPPVAQPPTTVKPVTPPPAVAITPPAPTPADPPRRRAVATSYAAGFAVAPDLIVTAAATIDGATRIMVQQPEGNPMEATLVEKNDQSGLALLKVQGKRLPHLGLAATFAGGPLQAVSFPTVSIFDPSAESLTGSSAAPKDDGWIVRLAKHPRLSGGPLLAGNKVVGVELASRESDASQIPCASLEELKKLLATQQIPAAGNVADPTMAALQVAAERTR